MKRAQVRDAIGWMLVAADRYPGLSVRTRNGWTLCSGLGWGRARGLGGPSHPATLQASGDGNQQTPLRSPLPLLGTATCSLSSLQLVQNFPRCHTHFKCLIKYLKKLSHTHTLSILVPSLPKHRHRSLVLYHKKITKSRHCAINCFRRSQSTNKQCCSRSSRVYSLEKSHAQPPT